MSFTSSFTRNQIQPMSFLGFQKAELDCQKAELSGNKKRYDSELPYQRPDLIEVMEIEIDLTTSTNVHASFYKSVRECLDC